jgi:hypothetical protein
MALAPKMTRLMRTQIQLVLGVIESGGGRFGNAGERAV